MKNYFKRLFNKDKDKKKFVFTTRNLTNYTGNGERINTTPNQLPTETWGSDSTGGMISFYNPNDSLQQSGVISTAPLATENKTVKGDERKIIEPKAVFEELKKNTPEVDFRDLDEKIRAVEERIKVLSEHMTIEHLKDEHMTLFYLKNRKQYLKTHVKNPIDWATTTRDAVDDLCKTYKLKVVAIKQYYTLIPKDGINEMDRYTKAYKAITGDNPIFELIIKDADVKTEEGKKEVEKQRKKDRDPILLANSPFGNALFILGAWDDEVEIVDEIIYGLK